MEIHGQLEHLPISGAAKEAKARVDEYLDKAKWLNANSKIKQITIFSKHWDDFEKSIKHKSKGVLSLEKDTYRGVRLIRGPKTKRQQ